MTTERSRSGASQTPREDWDGCEKGTFGAEESEAGGRGMDIGEPKRTIVVEPLEEPIPREEPHELPERTTEPSEPEPVAKR